MSWSAIVAAVAVAGCTQVFGLDPPTLDEDLLPQTVTGRFYAKYPHHNSQWQTVVDELVIPFTQAELRFADGARMPIPVSSDGAVEFQRTGREPYSVRFITDRYPPFELQHDASHFELVTYRTVRPDGVRALTGTFLAYKITDLVLPAGMVFTNSTGQWMDAPAVGGMNGNYTVDWAMANGNGDPPTLVQAFAYDRLFFTVMANLGPTGGLIADRVRVDDIDMTNSTATTVTGMTTAITRNQCMRLELPAATEGMRQEGAGFVESTVVGNWYIQSFPSAATPVLYSPVIASAAMSPPADQLFDVSYGNPFGGVPVLRMAVNRNHKLSLPGGGTTDVAIGSVYVVAGNVSCTTPTRIVPDIALPANVVLAGTALDSDRKTLIIDRSRPLELTWQQGGNGRSQRSQVALLKLAAADPGATVISFITVSGRVRVDPTLLEAGATYVFLISEQTGFPDAATGDMAFGLPWSFSYNYSGTFVVTN